MEFAIKHCASAVCIVKTAREANKQHKPYESYEYSFTTSIQRVFLACKYSCTVLTYNTNGLACCKILLTRAVLPTHPAQNPHYSTLARWLAARRPAAIEGRLDLPPIPPSPSSRWQAPAPCGPMPALVWRFETALRPPACLPAMHAPAAKRRARHVRPPPMGVG